MFCCLFTCIHKGKREYAACCYSVPYSGLFLYGVYFVLKSIIRNYHIHLDLSCFSTE